MLTERQLRAWNELDLGPAWVSRHDRSTSAAAVPDRQPVEGVADEWPDETQATPMQEAVHPRPVDGEGQRASPGQGEGRAHEPVRERAFERAAGSAREQTFDHADDSSDELAIAAALASVAQAGGEGASQLEPGHAQAS